MLALRMVAWFNGHPERLGICKQQRMTDTSYIGHEIKPLPGATLVAKIGGLPNGFDFERWPVCKSCGHRQKFLLQMDLHSPLKLAGTYRWAFVFACDDVNTCDPFLDDSGANAVILVTEADALSRMSEAIPKGIEPTSEERHLIFQPYSDVEEHLGRPELYLGFAPDYHFELVGSCLRCNGEMTVISQFEYDGSASFITMCKAECRDDAACFMW